MEISSKSLQVLPPLPPLPPPPLQKKGWNFAKILLTISHFQIDLIEHKKVKRTENSPQFLKFGNI